MLAPRLRHTVTIEREDAIVDSLGQPIPTWATVATVKASAEPTRGREYFRDAGVLATSPMLFVIRHRGDVKRQMRVHYGERAFRIEDIVDFREQHRELHLYCLGINEDERDATSGT